MDDASGHYTTGYFWGNNYWTGSMTLCRSILKTDDDSFFATKSENAHDGLTTINGNFAGARLVRKFVSDQLENKHQTFLMSLQTHENPPFAPRFGVLKVVLKETYTTPTVKRIFVIKVSFNIDYLNFSLVLFTSVCAFHPRVVKMTSSQSPSLPDVN